MMRLDKLLAESSTLTRSQAGKAIRDGRIERAKKLIAQGEKAVKRKGKNDVREYIQEVNFTEAGEVAENKAFSLDEDAILEASRYDGFYAVYTSLEAKKYPVSKINEINHGRWEIEECFRIMKSEFQARPVYLQKDNRIKAHFMTCFIALLILLGLNLSFCSLTLGTAIFMISENSSFRSSRNSGSMTLWIFSMLV